MTLNMDSLLREADPEIAHILNSALSEKEITADQGLALFNVVGNYRLSPGRPCCR